MVASRKNQSVFVENLLSLSPGSELQISDPEGEVALHSDADVQNIFIAGGIGVTPVRSIVEFATENNLKNRISLFYSNRSLSNSAFFSDFLKWTDENENFRLIPFFEKAPDAGLKFESGRIDSEILKKYLGNFKNKNFNILGPPEMVDSIRSMILKENVSEDKIKTERF